MICILIIEDEDLIRDSLEDLLLIEGFEVITAENGQRGVDLASKRRPDLIICDVMMPILNGYEVLQKIRQDKNLSTVPFLFLTSMMDRRSNRKGMSLGADDYLEKPCTKDELLEAIAVRLDKQKAIEQHIEEKMNTLRSNITLSLPHEFQTPLSGIMGLSELMMLLGEEINTAEIYECAQSIHQSAERLQRLIQNYLLYIRLMLMRSQGQTRFDHAYGCCSHLTICDTSDRKAKEYERIEDLELNVIEADLEISAEDLIKITEELIDNAFKYSKHGSKVSVSTQITDNRWILTIQDRGRGMNAEQIANIGAYMQFERQFYEQQGIGLGLIIAKTLVEFYGGHIHIQSLENENINLGLNSGLNLGTKVCVSFPH